MEERSLSERCREALVHRRIFVELTDGRTMCGQWSLAWIKKETSY